MMSPYGRGLRGNMMIPPGKMVMQRPMPAANPFQPNPGMNQQLPRQPMPMPMQMPRQQPMPMQPTPVKQTMTANMLRM